jgi:hypothetical protein
MMTSFMEVKQSDPKLLLAFPWPLILQTYVERKASILKLFGFLQYSFYRLCENFLSYTLIFRKQFYVV